MAESPWGWYVPMTSPTTLAHLLWGRSGRRPRSNIEYRIRRCTGLSPSRTSGRARETMTDMEYSRNERSISSWISIGSMKPRTAVSPPPPSPPPPSPELPFVPAPRVLVGGAIVSVPSNGVPSDVEEAHILGVGLDEVAPQLDVVAHQYGADVVSQRRLLDVDLEQ